MSLPAGREWSREEVEAFAQSFRDGMPTRNITHIMSTLKKSFSGKEALEWVAKQEDVNDRKEAEALCQTMLAAHVFTATPMRSSTFVAKRTRLYRMLGRGDSDFSFLPTAEQRTDRRNQFEERKLALSRGMLEYRIERPKADQERDEAAALEGLLPVPAGPPALPIVGNLSHIDIAGPQQSIARVAREYGACFRFQIIDHKYVVVSDPALVHQVATRMQDFGKYMDDDVIFKELKKFRGEGLTTISDGETHRQCQRVVLSALTQVALRRYALQIPPLVEAALEAELAAGQVVDFKQMVTYMALDVIGTVACSISIMDGSPRMTKLHKYLHFCADLAAEKGYRGADSVPGSYTVVGAVYHAQHKKFNRGCKYLHETVRELVQERRQELADGKRDTKAYDMLDVLLTEKLCPASGSVAPMDEDLIINNVLTLLSAGHGMYRVLAEVDSVSRGNPDYVPVYDDLKEMNYLERCMLEALRLFPPIPSILRMALKATNLGPYRVEQGENIMVQIMALHRSKKVWGEDAETFNPDRFLPAKKERMNPYAFIPWAFGARQCVGRQFAMVTGRLALFMMLNKYCFSLHRKARLGVAEALFMKPSGMLVTATVRLPRVVHTSGDSRDGQGAKKREGRNGGTTSNSKRRASGPGAALWQGRVATKRLVVCFGSNLGVAQGCADTLVDQAAGFGFSLVECLSLDDYLPTLQECAATQGGWPDALLVVTATYNGLPPDNAKKFAAFLQGGKGSLLAGLRYAVFGCGNKQWSNTYQQVAKMCDRRMLDLGAHRISQFSCGDASEDLNEDFLDWGDALWRDLLTTFGVDVDIAEKEVEDDDPMMDVGEAEKTEENKTGHPAAPPRPRRPTRNVPLNATFTSLNMSAKISGAGAMRTVPEWEKKADLPTVAGRFSVVTATLEGNSELQQAGAPRSTRHLVVRLPAGTSYRAGDHLGVCPFNRLDECAALLQRHWPGLGLDSVVCVDGLGARRTRGFLPHDHPLSLRNILQQLLDLNALPSRKYLAGLVPYAVDRGEAKQLRELAATTREGRAAYTQWLQQHRPVTAANVLRMFPSIKLEFGRWCELMTPLRPRHYSIASSPKSHPDHVHLCVGVVHDTYEQGREYHGTASSYLSSCQPGDKLNVFVVDTKDTFDLPEDDSIPIIMVCAGTGMSPFRGFLQERQQRRATGATVLCFGCRTPLEDLLFHDELQVLQQAGVLSQLWLAFSRAEAQGHPKQYVQDQLLQHADEVWEILHAQQGHFYICGAGNTMGRGVREAVVAIAKDKLQCDEEAAQEWLAAMQHQRRWVADVWG